MDQKLIILKKVLDWTTLASAAVGAGGFAAGWIGDGTAVFIVGVAVVIKAIGSLVGDKWDDGVFNNSFK